MSGVSLNSNQSSPTRRTWWSLALNSRLKVNRQEERSCKLILAVNLGFMLLGTTKVRICGKSVKTSAIQGKTFNYWLFWRRSGAALLVLSSSRKSTIFGLCYECLFSWINNRGNPTTWVSSLKIKRIWVWKYCISINSYIQMFS